MYIVSVATEVEPSTAISANCTEVNEIATLATTQASWLLDQPRT